MDLENIERVRKLIEERDSLYRKKEKLTNVKKGKVQYDIRFTVYRHRDCMENIALSDEMIDLVINHEIEEIDKRIGEIDADLLKL